MKILKLFILSTIFALNVNAQTYQVTDANSTVGFVIKNFGIKTNGSLTGLNGTVNFNPKALATSTMNVTVNSSTINTDNNARDKHLKKEEYFNVEKFAQISFVSTKITESTVAGRFFVVGNLTIKGVTKSVQFGFTATPNTLGYKFSGEFEINRRDFGVGKSSMALSDKLKVVLNIQANK